MASKVVPTDVKVGDTFPTTKGGDCLVIKVKSKGNITVVFKENINHEIVTDYRTLKVGHILNPYFATYFGQGYLGVGKYRMCKNKRPTTSYSAWRFLMIRLFCEKRLLINPTYRECTICKEWLNFQVFSEWFYSCESYGKGYEIDKDLLVQGNKHYSPETCVMLPQEINKALKTVQINSVVAGVRKRKNTKGYQVRVTEFGKRRHVGEFYTVEEASAAYVEAKERYIKNLALAWANRIEWKAFVALMNWRVYPEETLEETTDQQIT